MSRISLLHLLLVLQVRSNGVLEFELLYDADRRLLSSQGVPECCSPSPPNEKITTGVCENSCTNITKSFRADDGNVNLHVMSGESPSMIGAI